MPRAWRICKARHAAQVSSGEGARLYGGRWTSPGLRVVYASESLSLAVLEVIAHIPADAVAGYSVFTIQIPDDLVTSLDRALPEGWRVYPAPQELRAIGDDWVHSGRSAVLKVPSVITVHEYNFLINPSHRAFGRIVFRQEEPLDMDPRVLGEPR